MMSTPSAGSRHPRLHAVAFPVLAVALCLPALGGCSDRTAPDAAVSGTFVGVAQETAAVTMVVVDAAPPDGAGMRRVTVYACDSKERGTIVWFAGEVTGNDFTLRSTNGEATVTGRLSRDGVTGTVDDAAARFRFALRPARPGEGIYTVTVDSGGALRGTSPGGARLEGRFPALGAAAAGAMVPLTLVLPDGSRQSFTEPSHEATGAGTFRANVLIENGHFGVRGANFPLTTARAALVGPNRIIGLDHGNVARP